MDKSKVDPARLSQTHGLELNPVSTPEANTGSEGPPLYEQSQPPYLFHDGASLLEMTRKHNVGASTPCTMHFTERRVTQKTIAQLVYDNELHYLSPFEIRVFVPRVSMDISAY